MKNLDFEWLTDEFMLYCRSTQLREKTMSSYEQTLHLFGRWLSDELKIYTVDKITENVIRKYIDDLMVRGKYTFYVNDLSKSKNCPDRRRDYRKPVSVTTINNYIRNIRVFFNWMEREYIIRKNPMKRIRQLKYNRQAKVFLSDEDLKKLLSKFDKSYFTEHRDYVMVMLMLDSGMRLGECSTVLVTDLELGRKRINLRAEETKGRKDRTVYFSPKTEIVIRRWLQFKDRYVESDYLFPVKEHGGSIGVGNFESNFKKYLRRCGLNEEYTEFLGTKVVCHTLPIRPGRNLAVIVETAAANNRQKKLGYNAAQELYRRVQESISGKGKGTL